MSIEQVSEVAESLPAAVYPPAAPGTNNTWRTFCA